MEAIQKIIQIIYSVLGVPLPQTIYQQTVWGFVRCYKESQFILRLHLKSNGVNWVLKAAQLGESHLAPAPVLLYVIYEKGAVHIINAQNNTSMIIPTDLNPAEYSYVKALPIQTNI